MSKSQNLRVSHILRVGLPTPYDITLKLTDGTERTINLQHRVSTMKASMFAKAFVDHGTLAWPNGWDICPDVLLQTEIATRVAKRWIQSIPALCQIDGASIYIYPNDHPPPHIHVLQGGTETKIDVLDGKILVGKLKPALYKKVKAWLQENKFEVYEAYLKLQAGKNPGKIPYTKKK